MKQTLILALIFIAALLSVLSVYTGVFPLLGAAIAYALFVFAFRMPFGEDDESIIDRLKPEKRFVTAFFAPFFIMLFFLLLGVIARFTLAF